MKKVIALTVSSLAVLTSCNNDATEDISVNSTLKLKNQDDIEFVNRSVTPSFLDVKPGFNHISVTTLLSSEDVLQQSEEFVYGSMADGAGLIKENNGKYTLINNIEADYSIARITFDKTFKPVRGEYILNAEATANTAQCSGSLITPEEHGFGPLYLSGGEWGGSSKGVFLTNPYKKEKDASAFQMLSAFGQWSTENAVVIGQNAYPGKTVAFIGDDHSDNSVPSGQLGMYVGDHGDLYGGQLYGLKVTGMSNDSEVAMIEGQEYPVEFVELNETNIDLLDAECKAKGVMGFSRLEDIDWRRGSEANNRELYFCVTGRKRPSLEGLGTQYGRVYKVVLNENDPTQPGTITCILDGDKNDGIAKMFHSPDNILATENYLYIQEDPNGYFDGPNRQHFAQLYQYNLNTGELKTVLECDQTAAEAAGYGTTNSTWELTGMIDVSDVVNKEGTFLLITQNHGWEPADGSSFTDPNANPDLENRKEGSVLYLINGLER
ncbi:PhoX family protein [Aestuariibaculum sediminum]|uniref:Phosphatase n=1 Tax=Aestuariibaculum sediminum TaxID=2770637 RepID=A0A8J6Q9N9_9FLAO|nr:phosphatase [Aestuariibaculum sediminum]MBD0832647.1 phosphatase [Aestuariibaculum sediminum]